MKTILQFLERWPLALSIFAFLVGLDALGKSFNLFEPSYYDHSFYMRATISCVVSLSLCLAALINLVRAQMRGYSSQRGRLSVVILFLAFVGPILLTVRVASHYLRN